MDGAARNLDGVTLVDLHAKCPDGQRSANTKYRSSRSYNFLHLSSKLFAMEIRFASAKLRKQLNQQRTMQRAFGEQRAKRLRVVLTALRAATHLGVLAPPYSPPHRCHELTGNRQGTLSLDLDGPFRLILQPAHDPLPLQPEGGLNWSAVTVVEILGIENTHG